MKLLRRKYKLSPNEARVVRALPARDYDQIMHHTGLTEWQTYCALLSLKRKGIVRHGWSKS